MKRFDKLLPKLKTREAELRFISKIAEGVWNAHQRALSGRIPSDIPKYSELTEHQKEGTIRLVERILLQLQNMKMSFK